MTFNAELARQALADIDADPERWNQMSYRGRCGTTQCFAGFVAMRAGAQWRDVDRQSLAYDMVVGPLVDDWVHVSNYAVLALFGRNLSSDEQLDLDRDGLFADTNTRERLAELVDELAAGSAA